MTLTLHHDLDIDVDEICTFFVNRRLGCSKGASSSSRIQVNGKRPRNCSAVQPRLAPGRGCGGMMEKKFASKESNSSF